MGRILLKQSVLVKFIRDRYKRFFATFDLDVLPEMEKCLQAVGLELHKHFCPIGIDAPGKKDVEGLLPDEIKNTVRIAYPNLVDQAVSGTTEERRKAKQELKRLYLARRSSFTSKTRGGILWGVLQVFEAYQQSYVSRRLTSGQTFESPSLPATVIYEALAFPLSRRLPLQVSDSPVPNRDRLPKV